MSYVDVAGSSVYHEIVGSGEPVLLLHGGFCSIETMRPQIESLSEAFELHAPERPGHGRTADTDGPISYAGSVAETIGYMDAVGLDSAHVIGFSDGAIIGLLMAIDQPQRVRSLVAISGNLRPEGIAPHDDSPAVFDDLGSTYAALSPDGGDHAEPLLEKLMRMWTTEPDITIEQLATITAPTLVMAADRDVVTTGHTVSIAEAISGAQLCIVPGATHGLMLERPALVNAVLHEFVANAARPERSSGDPY